jgi:hypothetical protein
MPHRCSSWWCWWWWCWGWGWGWWHPAPQRGPQPDTTACCCRPQLATNLCAALLSAFSLQVPQGLAGAVVVLGVVVGVVAPSPPCTPQLAPLSRAAQINPSDACYALRLTCAVHCCLHHASQALQVVVAVVGGVGGGGAATPAPLHPPVGPPQQGWLAKMENFQHIQPGGTPAAAAAGSTAGTTSGTSGSTAAGGTGATGSTAAAGGFKVPSAEEIQRAYDQAQGPPPKPNLMEVADGAAAAAAAGGASSSRQTPMAPPPAGMLWRLHPTGSSIQGISVYMCHVWCLGEYMIGGCGMQCRCRVGFVPANPTPSLCPPPPTPPGRKWRQRIMQQQLITCAMLAMCSAKHQCASCKSPPPPPPPHPTPPTHTPHTHTVLHPPQPLQSRLQRRRQQQQQQVATAAAAGEHWTCPVCLVAGAAAVAAAVPVVAAAVVRQILINFRRGEGVCVVGVGVRGGGSSGGGAGGGGSSGASVFGELQMMCVGGGVAGASVAGGYAHLHLFCVVYASRGGVTWFVLWDMFFAVGEMRMCALCRFSVCAVCTFTHLRALGH